VPIVVPPLLGAPAGTPVSDEDLEPEAELPNREDDGDAEQPIPGVGSGPVAGLLGSG